MRPKDTTVTTYASSSSAPEILARLVNGLRHWTYRGPAVVGAGGLFAALIASRRIDCVTAPQFWAEDRAFWYAEAYDQGLVAPLLRPVGGYLRNFPKAVAAASSAFDISNALLFFSLVALAIHAIVPLFTRFLVLLVPKLAQITILLLQAPQVRMRQVSRGASLENLLRIFGGQTVAASLVGQGVYSGLYPSVLEPRPTVLVVVGGAGLTLLAIVFVRTRSFALRSLLIVAALHLAASLSSPRVIGSEPRWELLQIRGAGQRYYTLAILAFLTALSVMALGDASRTLRTLASVLVGVFVMVTVPSDWWHPAHERLDFPAQVVASRTAARGEGVVLQISPRPWKMRLTKH